MEFNKYERRPFTVMATQITDGNLEEAASLLGELVVGNDGEKMIMVDRRRINNIQKAYVGWWITRMDDQIRIYAPKVFENQFQPSTETKPEPLRARRDEMRDGVY